MFHVEHLQNRSSNNKKGQRRALAFLVFGALIELSMGRLSVMAALD